MCSDADADADEAMVAAALIGGMGIVAIRFQIKMKEVELIDFMAK